MLLSQKRMAFLVCADLPFHGSENGRVPSSFVSYLLKVMCCDFSLQSCGERTYAWREVSNISQSG